MTQQSLTSITRVLDEDLARIVVYETRHTLRYGVPLVLVALAVLAVDIASPFLSGGGIFLVLLLPVIVVAVGLGFLAGTFALGLGAAGAAILVVVRDHPWLSDPVDVLRLALYLLAGLVVIVLAFALRELLRRSHGLTETTSVAPSATETPDPADGRSTPAAIPLPPLVYIEPPTRREREVLVLAAAGYSTRAIGRRLFLSENTIKSHLAHAYDKLGVRNRAQAVAAAIQAGWIGPPHQD